MTKFRILLSDSFDPYFNVAIEQWLFSTLESDSQVLFLWRNHNTVVIGRSQNPWLECNLTKMQEDEVALVRRQTGGGAVFHDLGNTNFTFLTGAVTYDKQLNSQIITTALQKFNIKAQASGRNDIVIEHPSSGELRKVSGSAYREMAGKALHHGTLLISADLQRLGEYLNPRPKKLIAKGIQSVRARVSNLADIVPEIEHGILCEAIIESFLAQYNVNCNIEMLDTTALRAHPDVNVHYAELKNWDWQYGKTMPFTHHLEQQFAWGGLDILLQVSAGKVETVQVYSDSLQPELAESIQQKLQGLRYDVATFKQAFVELISVYPNYQQEFRDCGQWIVNEVN